MPLSKGEMKPEINTHDSCTVFGLKLSSDLIAEAEVIKGDLRGSALESGTFKRTLVCRNVCMYISRHFTARGRKQ